MTRKTAQIDLNVGICAVLDDLAHKLGDTAMIGTMRRNQVIRRLLSEAIRSYGYDFTWDDPNYVFNAEKYNQHIQTREI